MGRRPRHPPPLRVYQNSRLVGFLRREPGGAILFQYADSPDDHPSLAVELDATTIGARYWQAIEKLKKGQDNEAKDDVVCHFNIRVARCLCITSSG